MLRRMRIPSAMACVAVLAAIADARPVAAQAQLFVNTTADLPVSSDQCLPGKVCTLRAAIEKAESVSSGAIITACFDPTVVPNAKKCQLGFQPLLADDPGFDAVLGKWRITLASGSQNFVMSKGGTRIEFGRFIDGYAGPADNRMQVASADGNQQVAFRIESNGNVLSALDFTGTYQDSALLLKASLAGDGSANNVLGPGLTFAGLSSGNGIRISDPSSVNNRIIGSWCGMRGDGEIDPVAEDCFVLDKGTSGNTIGGASAADRNIFAASALGVGVKIEGPGSADNAVVGNWIGLDRTGVAKGDLPGGVLVVHGAVRTRVVGNVIAGVDSDAIGVFEESLETVIEDNLLGFDATGTKCIALKGAGVSLNFGPKQTVVRHNRVRCTRGGGITISGAGSTNNRISENSIGETNQKPIVFSQGAQGRIAKPVVTDAGPNFIAGRACGGCTIEVFSDPAGEAQHFEGRTVADAADATFRFELPTSFRFHTISVTATNGQITSELSNFRSVQIQPTRTPAGPSPTPGPTPSDTLFESMLYLPWSARGAFR
jgi:CSLREA domain-containing protein